jgi:hypothetical protein
MGSTCLLVGPDVNGGFYGSPDDPSEASSRNYHSPTTHIAQIWADIARWFGDDPSFLSPAKTDTLGLLA